MEDCKLNDIQDELNIHIGKTYPTFDDGKIRNSRKYDVEIVDIIPANEIDSDTYSVWLQEVKECYWLYSEETDFFIKGILSVDEDDKIEIYYVRTLDRRWFSLGDWGGLLDNKLIYLNHIN